MKMYSKLGLGVLAVGLLAFTVKLNDGHYEVSVQKSKIEWIGKKVTGQHNGTIELKSGSFIIKDGELSGGEFIIDMTTLTSTDLDGKYLTKLNGHLKSDDFFGIEKYPEARLIITDVNASGNGRFKVTGDMTIKATTKPISFDTQLIISGNSIVAIANIVIDRSEFDVRYGSGSFFDDLGDKTIYDDFTLAVNIVTE